MSKNINSLRSQLQFACSDALQSITTQDLDKCKWSIKRKIFTAIIEASPSLTSLYSDLIDLVENHNTNMNDFALRVKQQSLDTSTREQRAELESQFRSEFMRVVVACLAKLRWPPALEAFSDPVTDLFHDNAFCHEAMGYILKVGIPRATDRLSRARSENSIPVHVAEDVSSIDLTSADTSMHHEEVPIALQISTPYSEKRTPPAATKYKSRSLLKVLPGNVSEASDLSTISYVPSPTTITPRFMQPDRDSSLQNITKKSSSSSKSIESFPPSLIKLQRSFEAIQAQNFALTRQCSTMQKYISTRALAEDRIELLLQDIMQSLTSAKESLPSKCLESYPSPSPNPPPQIEARINSNRSKQSTTTTTHRSLRQPSKPLASYTSSSSSKAATKGETSFDSISSNTSSTNPPPTSTSDIIPSTSKMTSKLDSLLQQWKSARREAASQASSLSNDKDTSHPAFPATAIDIKTRILLGIRSTINAQGNNVIDPRHKIQLLQKDLFHFAIHAHNIIQSTSTSISTSYGFNQKDADMRREYDELSMQCQDLLLHLSDIAPLISENDTCDDIVPACTGLEELLHEVSQLIMTKGISKATIQRISQASDRARSEQTSLVRSLVSARRHLQKWPVAADCMKETLEQHRLRNRGMLKKTMKDFQSLQSTTATIMTAFDEACKVRMATDNSMLLNTFSSIMASKVMVSPIDALGKGAMGDKVALLVNSLKVYLDEIDNLRGSLSGVCAKLDEEVIRVDVDIDELSGRLALASDASKAVLTLPIQTSRKKG